MNSRSETARILSMRNIMVFVYTLLAALLFASTCFYFISFSERSLKTQSENYTTMAAQQSATNVNTYFRNIEQSHRVIFDDMRLVEFYPAGGQLTGDELSIASEVTELFTKASYTADYVDLGVIYEGGGTAGIVSDGTLDLLGFDPYSRACQLLGENDSGWAVFFSGNVSRTSFIKRLNPHAVTISSVYASKLTTIFSKLMEPANLSLIVTDDTDRVIYSSENTPYTAGDRLETSIITLLDGRENITVGGDGVTVCLISLDNGWHMYSMVTPVKAENRVFGMTVENYIIIVGMSVLLIFVVAGMIISAYYLSDRSIKKVTEYDTDPDTGVLTAFYCEETVSEQIETTLAGSTWAFTLVKIKDIELMGERLGEDFVRSGKVKLASLLIEGFGEDTTIGLNDRGEFVVFSDFSDFDIFKAHDTLKQKHEDVRKLFSELLVGDDEDIKLDVAMGVCVYPDNGKDYDELDNNALTALEKALTMEKDSLAFYEEKKKQGGDR